MRMARVVRSHCLRACERMPVAPTSPPRSDDAELKRRRRARNWAMLAVLVGLCALFYAITLVKLSRPLVGG